MTIGLTGVLRDIAEVAGADAAHKIAMHLGGHEIYLSENPRPSNRLVKLVGRKMAILIAEKIGAGQLVIPQGPSSRPVRGQQLARDGLSRREIAEAMRVHERTAARYQAAARDDSQPELPFED